MMDPLRAYVRPRGRRLDQSAIASKWSHQRWPQNVEAMSRPLMLMGLKFEMVFWYLAMERRTVARFWLALGLMNWG
jgi:hypothetical protein